MKKTYTLELTDDELDKICLALLRDSEYRRINGEEETAKMLRSVDSQLLKQKLGLKF